MAALIGIGLVFLGAGVIQILRRPKKTCVYVHSEDGANYPWLSHIHGGLHYIQYEEPAGSGIWRDYTDAIWKIHCKVIPHDPDQLADVHVKAFVDPATRFARLAFHFRDGTVMEPTREFYDLEAKYFRNRM